MNPLALLDLATARLRVTELEREKAELMRALGDIFAAGDDKTPGAWRRNLPHALDKARAILAQHKNTSNSPALGAVELTASE